VRETLAALAARYPGRRLVAVFEPRTNTSRRKLFQRDYAEAFVGAGQVLISVVPDAPIYSATGEVTELFSSEQLASDLRERGTPANALEGIDAIVTRLTTDCRPGDVVIVMSNGEFSNLGSACRGAAGSLVEARCRSNTMPIATAA
jgi:UDP-N-acetylmuramate: L-alanyl-gamma-D-glutamyl-meso-diaminopimelate ligase